MIIAHRANLTGPDPTTENTLEQIQKVLETTEFYVEIDVWATSEGSFYLGHDAPMIPISSSPYEYLDNPRFFIHAKNLLALNLLVPRLTQAHIFSHDEDPVVLTYPKGYAWVYPGCPIDARSICVMPERTPDAYSTEELVSCLGICTDYPFYFKSIPK